LPSRRRTRACRARPSRKPDSCPGRRRDRRRGKGSSSVRLRRKSRMRAVMALSSKGQWTAQSRPHCGSGGALARAAWRQRVRELTQRRAMETRTVRWAFDPAMLPWIGAGNPFRTAGKEGQASSVPTFGGPARPRSPLRRCFKPRPSWRTRCAGFASGCRSSSEEGDLPQAAGGPLVPLPTDRHVATGTCEFGRRAT
jgi:hypothetical protein